MSLANRRARRARAGGNGAAREITRTPLGGVRRTQIITTYGVGSMVAISDQSYIISGIDSWKVDDNEFSIYEPRLQQRLGVHGFRLPPAWSPPKGDGVRVRLFPEYYSCPQCHDLKPFRAFGSPRGKSVCGNCEKNLTPARFVMACEKGHLDDFPYFAWVHKKTSPTETGKSHHLSLHSTGRTASLRSVVIKCSCGKEASLEGAFGRRALEMLGIACTGRRPWLGKDHDQPQCTAIPRTLQRGSSAAWFPVNRSALSIPPWSKALQKWVNSKYKILKTLTKYDEDDTARAESIKESGILDNTAFTPESVIGVMKELQELETSRDQETEESIEFEPGGNLRREEYKKLLDKTDDADRGDDFECVPPAEDPSAPLPFGTERVRLVKRLREVRVLEAFTRVQSGDSLIGDAQHAAIYASAVDWLPAIEVSGEGVFLTLDQARLREWESTAGPIQRIARIQRNHTAQLRHRAREAQTKKPLETIVSPVSPRYVLLHTLAHALINEWSLDAGYPAASLRERLYLSNDMAGVLIYTATSDSAGSLGGLVAQGEYKRIRDSFESALNRISWCSQDPPCMESVADKFGNLNLAACYACVFLPETSCETNNTFLDRALLIGTPDDSSVGFFSRRD